MSNIVYLGPLQAPTLIEGSTKDAIGAEALEYHHTARSTWDGEGYDVRFDFVVLWKRDVKRDRHGVESWGTHRGCIRQKLGEEPCAHIYEGNYDMDEKTARQDFISRQVALG